MFVLENRISSALVYSFIKIALLITLDVTFSLVETEDAFITSVLKKLSRVEQTKILEYSMDSDMIELCTR